MRLQPRRPRARRPALLFGLLAAAAAGAAPTDLSFKVQSVLFRKIMTYDRSMPAGPPKVLVVYGDEASEAEEMAQALKDVDARVTVIKATALAAALAPGGAGASVVYLFPHALSPAVKELAVKAHVLSLGGSGPLAEHGEVAVALGFKGGRPEIVINLKVAKSEGQEFSSDLLNLATVIR